MTGDTNSIRWDDQEVREILEEEMYLPEHERLDGRREFDTRKYIFKYQVLDVSNAAAVKSKKRR